MVGALAVGCSEADSDSAQSASSGEATSDCGAEAQSLYEDAMAVPTFELPPDLDVSSLSGKRFAYIGIISNSIVEAKFEAFNEALESVGAEGILFNGEGRQDVISQAFQSAISQQVAGIVTDGYDAAAFVSSAVADANSAGIPVINNNAYDPSTPLPDGIDASVAVDVQKMGAIQADYALAQTDCELSAITIFTTASQLTVDGSEGFVAEVERLCPENCNVEQIDVNAATYATSLTPQLQTTLQRDPGINAIASSGGDLWVPYVVQAETAVGRDVLIVSGEGSGLQENIDGNGADADVLWTPADLLGYYAADAAMRAALDESASVGLPVRLVDATNWGDDGDLSAQFPEAPEIKEQFRSVWGVQ